MKKQNLADSLKGFLGAEHLQLLEPVREEAARQGLPLYIVGGSVRDLLLGRRVSDFDLTVEGDAIGLAHSLAARHGGSVTAHSKFRTAKWFLPENLRTDHQTLDLISARSETYRHPAALPTVRPGSIVDDLRRRDFTINALAIRLDGAHFGELRDDLNGMEDLQQRIVRVLHRHSFIDDPTRMYRAVRYEGRYDFKIALQTLGLIPEARGHVAKLSAFRIRRELDLILDEPNAVAMLSRLDDLDLLSAIHSALSDFERSYFAARASGADALGDRTSRWLAWLMHLTEQEVEFVNERLHFPADMQKTLRSAAALEANLADIVGLKPSQTVDLLGDYSLKAVEALAQTVRDAETRNILLKYLSEWRHVRPQTTGHDLKKRGVPPGPKYNEILRRLRAAWLDGELKSEQEEEKMLETIIQTVKVLHL